MSAARDELHRLVDVLDEAKLSAALDALRAEHARPVLTQDEALAALHEFNDGPIPEAELARARAALARDRQAS